MIGKKCPMGHTELCDDSCAWNEGEKCAILGTFYVLSQLAKSLAGVVKALNAVENALVASEVVKAAPRSPRKRK